MTSRGMDDLRGTLSSARPFPSTRKREESNHAKTLDDPACCGLAGEHDSRVWDARAHGPSPAALAHRWFCGSGYPGGAAHRRTHQPRRCFEATSAPSSLQGEGEHPLYLSIIWHQHQPVYFKDPDTGVYAKPWVRVHAAKDYVDMAAMLEQYPDIHATFNLTPSLIRQLDDLTAGARDQYWLMTEVPADQLTDEDKAFIRDRFFDTNPKVIARFPRYQQIADDRENSDGWDAGTWRDLQVLFNLAWTDPDWLAREPLKALG